MKQYLDLVNRVFTEGHKVPNRTGIDTRAIFGHYMTFDLSEGFPLVTTKKVNLKAVINELLWFVHGCTNINDPLLGGSKIWDEWAVKPENLINAKPTTMDVLIKYAELANLSVDARRELVYGGAIDREPEELLVAVSESLGITPEELRRKIAEEQVGSIGPMYGAQWRNFGEEDQLQTLLKNLRERPFSRRHLVSAWNPTVLPDESISPEQNVLNGNGALAPCHCFFQFQVVPLETPNERLQTHKLNCQFYMRSSDIGLGLPFNIASYAALLLAICNQLDYAPGTLGYMGGDIHIYENQVEQLTEQLSRSPRALPTLRINRPIGTSIFELTAEDFVLEGYDPYPALKMTVAK